MESARLSPSTPSSRGMDKYEQLAVVGEGSYGIVLKCRNRDTGQLVAIKKFLETEEDAAVKKMALREIRMLKKLRHDHLVNMIEVFRRKRRFYLVFEYLDHTLLDELEAASGGLGEETARKHLFQLLKGIDYCHQNSIIHRDVKPENVLVSNNGIVKLCDLGFARTLAAPGEPYTEYVATRWYRAPELLVAEHKYGSEVDIWAIGCLFAEMLTGEPLFPGDSDIDQLALIIKAVGKLAPRHQQVVSRLAGGGALNGTAPANRPALPGTGLAKDLLTACLRTEPRARPSAQALLRHKYFISDGFAENFNAELRKKLGKDIETPSPQQSTNRISTKQRQQWTLRLITDHSRSRTESSVEEPFQYYAPCGCTTDAPMEPMPVEPKIPPSVAGVVQKSSEHSRSLPPAAGRTRPMPQPKSLGKAINDTFQSFPVPVNTYPRTPYIKKVNNKLVIDDDVLKSRINMKKGHKKNGPELSLPYVPGASNSPVKKVKKTFPNYLHQTHQTTAKTHDSWDSGTVRSGTEVTQASRTPTNLPYM